MGHLLPGVQHLQNIHPMVVPFPLAFLTGAAQLYPVAWILRVRGMEISAFTLLILGALGALAAVGTDLYAESGVMISRSVREHLLEVHEKLMLTTLRLSLLCAV